MPDIQDLILLGLCGPIAVAGTILLTKAYREAPPGAVTPIEYMALIWATLWGFALFAEVPSGATIVGAALIISSGIFAVTRGASVARAAQ
jgi:drug/metabolite transporter (DMT)-like permease